MNENDMLKLICALLKHKTLKMKDGRTLEFKPKTSTQKLADMLNFPVNSLDEVEGIDIGEIKELQTSNATYDRLDTAFSYGRGVVTSEVGNFIMVTNKYECNPTSFYYVQFVNTKPIDVFVLQRSVYVDTEGFDAIVKVIDSLTNTKYDDKQALWLYMPTMKLDGCADIATLLLKRYNGPLQLDNLADYSLPVVKVVYSPKDECIAWADLVEQKPHLLSKYLLSAEMFYEVNIINRTLEMLGGNYDVFALYSYKSVYECNEIWGKAEKTKDCRGEECVQIDLGYGEILHVYKEAEGNNTWTIKIYEGEEKDCKVKFMGIASLTIPLEFNTVDSTADMLEKACKLI